MSEAAAPAVETAASPAPEAGAPAAAPAPADQGQGQGQGQPSTLLTEDAPKPEDKPNTDAAEKDGEGKEGEDAGKEKSAEAPAEYADFDLPEGIKLDEPVMGEFKGLAKELGLTQEQAQKLVSLGANMQKGNAETFTTQLQAKVDETAKGWATEAKADKEIGGDKFDENLGVAKSALDTFGTPELKKLLAESRLGNHPEVLRFMYRAGKAISQDGFVPGRASTAAKSTADVLYGSPKQ